MIIPKILINYDTPAFKYGVGYAEFLREITRVMADQPLYFQTFYDLVQMVLNSKHWKRRDLEDATNTGSRTMYNYLYNIGTNKDVILSICIALGLDLVSTMIFLMSSGFILYPITSEKDYKSMLFIENKIKVKANDTKSDGLDRISEWEKYIQDKTF